MTKVFKLRWRSVSEKAFPTKDVLSGGMLPFYCSIDSKVAFFELVTSTMSI